MDRIVIAGGARLEGEVRIGGAKNAALPIMAATLLAPGVFTLTNVPSLVDVRTMGHVLRVLGAQVDHHDHSITVDTTNCRYHEAPYELVKTMRASIYVLGPLLARALDDVADRRERLGRRDAEAEAEPGGEETQVDQVGVGPLLPRWDQRVEVRAAPSLSLCQARPAAMDTILCCRGTT